MLKTILSVSQMVFAVILIIFILLQQKGTGLGAAFGGSSNIYTTKRGIDKMLFRGSIVVSILFFLVALASLVV
jgi:preprotein translocase subunit SecG